MTLDAMHWVWTSSQSKGNTRLALLYVADQVRTSACEVRLSYPDFMRALNASSKSTVRSALEAAEELGELKVAEPSAGRRAPLYQLTKAVDYARPTGTEPVPKETRSGTGSVPQSPSGKSPTGTEPVPQESRSGTDFVRSGTDFDPLYPYPVASQQAGEPKTQQQDDSFGIPEFARPLVDGLSSAGVVVRWPYVGNQWLIVHALIKKSGVQAMVDHARKAASRANVESAKYFMQGWRELPPLPRSTPPDSAPPRPAKAAWCEDPDCDPVTRTRDVENDRGLRFSQPCPKCHPASRKDPAA